MRKYKRGVLACVFFLMGGCSLLHGAEEEESLKPSFSVVSPNNEKAFREAMDYWEGRKGGWSSTPDALLKAEKILLPLASQNHLPAIYKLVLLKSKQKASPAAYKWLLRAATVVPLSVTDKEFLFDVPEKLLLKAVQDRIFPSETRLALAQSIFSSSAFLFPQAFMEPRKMTRKKRQVISKSLDHPAVQDTAKWKLSLYLLEDPTFDTTSLIPDLMKLSVSPYLLAAARWKLISYLLKLEVPFIQYPDTFAKWISESQFNRTFRYNLARHFFQVREEVKVNNYRSYFLSFLKEDKLEAPYLACLFNLVSLYTRFPIADKVNVLELHDYHNLIWNYKLPYDRKAVIIMNLMTVTPELIPYLAQDILFLLEDLRIPLRTRGVLLDFLLSTPLENLQPFLSRFINIWVRLINSSPSLEIEEDQQKRLTQNLLRHPFLDLKEYFYVFEEFLKKEALSYESRVQVATLLLMKENYSITERNLSLFIPFCFYERSLDARESFILQELAKISTPTVQQLFQQDLQRHKVSIPGTEIHEEDILY